MSDLPTNPALYPIYQSNYYGPLIWNLSYRDNKLENPPNLAYWPPSFFRRVSMKTIPRISQNRENQPLETERHSMPSWSVIIDSIYSGTRKRKEREKGGQSLSQSPYLIQYGGIYMTVMKGGQQKKESPGYYVWSYPWRGRPIHIQPLRKGEMTFLRWWNYFPATTECIVLWSGRAADSRSGNCYYWWCILHTHIPGGAQKAVPWNQGSSKERGGSFFY